jgi:hypothetical protein
MELKSDTPITECIVSDATLGSVKGRKSSISSSSSSETKTKKADKPKKGKKEKEEEEKPKSKPVVTKKQQQRPNTPVTAPKKTTESTFKPRSTKLIGSTPTMSIPISAPTPKETRQQQPVDRRPFEDSTSSSSSSSSDSDSDSEKKKKKKAPRRVYASMRV